jgi:carotenoid cleavage dioxygenase
MWSENAKFLNGIYEPLQNEFFISELRVEGAIPKDLSGTLYRNGSNQHYHPTNPDRFHWFDGDGMVHAFRIQDGKASYRNKWVQTEGLAVEKQAGKSLYNGLYGQSNDPQRPLPAGAPSIKLVANVNVIALAHKVYATQESGSHWYELVPDTLDVRDVFNFDGEIKAALTAHPHTDPKTGDMLFYVLDSDGLSFDCCRATADGKFVQRHTVKLDAPAWVHDFMFTEDYFIVFLGPLCWHNTMDNYVSKGKSTFAFDAEIGTRIMLVNRNTGAVRWFHDKTTYQPNHYLNAYQIGNKVILDGTVAEVIPVDGEVVVPDFFPFPMSNAPNPFTPPFLWRWTFDLDKGTVEHERIGEFIGEFVRPNERYMGEKHRYGYLSASHQPKSDFRQFNCLIKQDFDTGRTEYQYLSKTSDMSPGEPIFVPRDGATSEDDGYLMAVWWDPKRDRSEMVIHAAQDFEGEPLARIHLDHRVPLGFHGNWVSDAELGIAAAH